MIITDMRNNVNCERRLRVVQIYELLQNRNYEVNNKMQEVKIVQSEKAE